MKKFDHLRSRKGCYTLVALILLATVAPWNQSTAQAATKTWQGYIRNGVLNQNAGDGETPQWQDNDLTFTNTDVILQVTKAGSSIYHAYYQDNGESPNINVQNGNLIAAVSGEINNPFYLKNSGGTFNVSNGKFAIMATGEVENYQGQKIAINDSEGKGKLFKITANAIEVNDIVLRGAEGVFVSRKVNDGPEGSLDGSIRMKMLAHRGWLLTDTAGNLIDPNKKVLVYEGDPSGGPSMKANGLDTTIMKVDADGDVDIESLQIQQIGQDKDGANARWMDTEGYYSLVPIRTEVKGKNVNFSGINLAENIAKALYQDKFGSFGANAMDIGNAHVLATAGNIDISSRSDTNRLNKNQGVGYFMTKNGGVLLEAKKDSEEVVAGSTGNIYLRDGFVTDRTIKWTLDDQKAIDLDFTSYNKADLFLIADNDIE